MTGLNGPADHSALPVQPDPVSGVPNPGSREAASIGCMCPVLDNAHGRRAPYPPDGWWITEGCPVHDREAGEAA